MSLEQWEKVTATFASGLNETVTFASGHFCSGELTGLQVSQM